MRFTSRGVIIESYKKSWHHKGYVITNEIRDGMQVQLKQADRYYVYRGNSPNALFATLTRAEGMKKIDDMIAKEEALAINLLKFNKEVEKE